MDDADGAAAHSRDAREAAAEATAARARRDAIASTSPARRAPSPASCGRSSTIYRNAGYQYGIDWRVLAAINRVETNLGRNTHVSSAGAVGWMQFLPSTWRRWGVDASGDGIADPYDPQDAIFSAARYLNAAHGARRTSAARSSRTTTPTGTSTRCSRSPPRCPTTTANSRR